MFGLLQPRLAPGSRGLDFGSGPEQVLAGMFRNAGHRMAVHDRFYESRPVLPGEDFDFITATEVAEHLREPGRELDELWDLLRPGGWLGIMTRPAVAQQDFPSWHYKNDPTHICFYSSETFRWLGRRWNAELTFPESDMALFRKSGIRP